MNTNAQVILAAAAMFVAAGCKNGLTSAEARAALEESSVDSQAAALTSSSAEIGTHFTIGMAVENAANELKTFIESQLPCARVTLENATLAVEYGANAGSCLYMGKTFSGTHAISVMRNEMNDVLVHHIWTDLSDGNVTVSGSADVTWSVSAESRHVVYEFDWERMSDSKSGTGTGDVTQTALADGVQTGIEVNGNRAWTGQSGSWNLAIDGVQMRWIDPIPQAGRYTLSTPFDKEATLTFERLDGNTIKATLESRRNTFSWNVTALGILDS